MYCEGNLPWKKKFGTFFLYNFFFFVDQFSRFKVSENQPKLYRNLKKSVREHKGQLVPTRGWVYCEKLRTFSEKIFLVKNHHRVPPMINFFTKKIKLYKKKVSTFFFHGSSNHTSLPINNYALKKIYLIPSLSKMILMVYHGINSGRSVKRVSRKSMESLAFVRLTSQVL